MEAITDKPAQIMPHEAVGQEKVPHKRVFSPTEIENMRLQHTNKMIELDAENSELAMFKAIKAPIIKTLAADAGKLRTHLKTGFENVMVDCWIIPNHEERTMDYMDKETKELVWSRKMVPNELQLHVGGSISKVV